MSQLKSFIGRQVQSLKNTTQRYYSLYLAPIQHLYLQHKTPIIIYQMGKVGSSSIMKSLQATGYQPVYQVHFMSPDKTADVIQEYQDKNLHLPYHVLEGQQLYQHVVKRKQPVKYITLVREPIGRTLSDFFQNYELLTGQPFRAADHTPQETIDLFYQHSNPDYPLQWFDEEFEQALGFSVYDYPFPHEQGYLHIQHDHIDLLILRIEADDMILSQAIRDFTGLPDFDLQYANVGETKAYADIYQQVRREINLPSAFVDKLLDAKYTRHFYSDTERDNLRRKWLG